MNHRIGAALLGALTGLVTAVAMMQLVAGLFSGAMTAFALGFTLAATLPWIGYVAWRARRSRLSRGRSVAVLILGVAGLGLAWLYTLGPVLALAVSLAAFALIWLSDLPQRRAQGEARLVRVEELGTDD